LGLSVHRAHRGHAPDGKNYNPCFRAARTSVFDDNRYTLFSALGSTDDCRGIGCNSSGHSLPTDALFHGIGRKREVFPLAHASNGICYNRHGHGHSNRQRFLSRGIVYRESRSPNRKRAECGNLGTWSFRHEMPFRSMLCHGIEYTLTLPTRSCRWDAGHGIPCKFVLLDQDVAA